jgi:hypothetical protein
MDLLEKRLNDLNEKAARSDNVFRKRLIKIFKLSRSAFFDEKSIPFHEQYPCSP